MPKGGKHRKGRLRRWRALIIVGVLLVLLGVADLWVKNGAQHIGFAPPDASCLVAARDFGRFWQCLEETPAAQRFTEEVPRPLADFELAVRLTTGIRPTPSRWRLWMGKRLLWTTGDQGTGVCVYPGLLLRGVHFARRMTGRAGGSEGVYSFEDYHYAWRDGFLILSASRAYVEAALAADPAPVAAPDASNQALLEWQESHAGHLRLEAAGDLEVTGEIHVAATHEAAPLTLAGAWPESPLLSVTASSWPNLSALWTPASEYLEESAPWRLIAPYVQFIKERWGLGALPADWHKGFGECSVGLLGVDTGETVPVPELACVMRCSQPAQGAHPLRPLVAPLDTIPYEWQGNAGVLAPLMGEKLAICLGRSGKDWITTTRESLMTGLAGRFQEVPPNEADLVVRIDWEKTGAAAEKLCQLAGRLELMPGKNSEEVNRDYRGIARGLSHWGTLEIVGYARGDVLAFEGLLAQVPEEESE